MFISNVTMSKNDNGTISVSFPYVCRYILSPTSQSTSILERITQDVPMQVGVGESHCPSAPQRAITAPKMFQNIKILYGEFYSNDWYQIQCLTFQFRLYHIYKYKSAPIQWIRNTNFTHRNSNSSHQCS